MEPSLVVIGLNHRTARIDVRERFWMDDRRQQEALTALTRSEGIEEAFVFSTCNRTEFVVYGDPTLAENSVLRFLGSRYELKLCEWKNFYRLIDEQALAHAFRVSCGLDSMHIGEGQIGKQVTTAWQQAQRAGCTGPFLDRILKKALAVRRRVRKETSAKLNLESAPHAAVELANEIFGSLSKRNIVVLGSGVMARAAMKALADRGVESICLFRRTQGRALDYSHGMEIRVAPFAERYRSMSHADLVISATSARSFVLAADELCRTIAGTGARKRVMIDLALPRDIDPQIRQLDGALLYDLDDLEHSAMPRTGMTDAEVEAENIVLSEVDRFRKEQPETETQSEILALHQRLDEICRQELESFRQEQGPFPKDQDQLISAVTSRITHKIAGSLIRARASGPRL